MICYLIPILIVAIIVIYNVTAPKYRITLTGSDSTVFEDPLVAVVFGFKDKENLRKLTLIPFSIKNKTSQPMQILWDSSAFVDPSRESCRIIHSGVKLINKESSQPPTVIASNAKISDTIVPSDNITWASGNKDTPADWKYSLLLKPWASNKSFDFSILLYLKVGNEEKPYQFDFSATK